MPADSPEIEAVTLESFTPRPEYPRPQLTRARWMNLNGLWEFRVDDANVGLEQRWFDSGEFPDRILVPFSMETKCSRIGDRRFHPCVWYRRSFQVPAEWRRETVVLHFGAVDYRATVWMNGVVVAMHEGGHTPFSANITGELEAGDNIVVVRAEDPPTDRYIPRGKQHWEAEPVSIFYARTTGIWQTVWLEPVPASHLDSLRITPTIDGRVGVSARLAGPVDPSHFVTIDIWDGDRMLASAMSLMEGPRALLSAHLHEPKLWGPGHPHLYRLIAKLHNAQQVLDSVEAYFGVRSVAAQDGKVLLNGAPLLLKTVLDQGYWPESNLTPPSDDAIVRDIQQTLDLGFNGVRKHQKVEDPRYLYWADRMGLLVAAEMANAYLFNEDAVARMTHEWIQVVERDYNHPSIIIWTPVNESWGVPNLADKRQQAHLKALYYLTKSLDDTRLVIDNDGWEHTEVTDLFAIHDYTKTGAELLRRYQGVSSGVPPPLYGKMYLAPGHRYNGSPILLWEFGGVGYVPPEELPHVPESFWGYAGVESARGQALERIRGLYEALARMPQIAGICYTQLYDVEQEVNGLMTYGRRMKFDPAEIRRINELLG